MIRIWEKIIFFPFSVTVEPSIFIVSVSGVATQPIRFGPLNGSLVFAAKLYDTLCSFYFSEDQHCLLVF